MKTALVLSAGGMFGAYQAGAWKALAPAFRPDLVVGTSVGAINGWAMASDCPPDKLIETWLQLDYLSSFRLHFPTSWTDGILDSSPVNDMVNRVFAEFKPKIEYGAVITDTLKLRPVLFRTPQVTCEHLGASAAMLGFFRQYRIDGRVYSDGGLLDSLPIWAAAEMGATHVVAINALPDLPSVLVKAFVGGVRKVSGYRKPPIGHLEIIRITAPVNLGSAKDALYWKRANIARWIEKGQKDGEAALAAGRIPHEVTK